MPPVHNNSSQTRQITCFDRVKLGFLTGCTIGVVTGIVFGGVASLRRGVRGRELIRTLGRAAATSGGTFGTFMAIAGAVRC